MSDAIELNLSDSAMDNLRCSACKGYLSSAPIRILADGSNLCGQCSPPDEETPIFRQQALETLMNEAVFPCKFVANGCRVRLPFGCTPEHESICQFRNISSRSGSPRPGCSREPNAERRQYVVHNGQIRVKINGDEKEVSIKSQDGSTVINPFNIQNRRRQSSATASVASNPRSGNHSHWGEQSNFPRPRYPHATQRPAHHAHPSNWHARFHNLGGRHGLNSPRNWQFYDQFGNRRHPFFKRSHRNSLVIIKGRTLYVTL